MKQMKPQKLHLNALTLLFAFLCASTIYAQQTTADVPKQADATLGQVTTSEQLTPHTTDPNTKAGTPGATVQGGAIRVIDNKGTKKYLQVQNGLTQVTNTAPAGGIVTTWQLGGQLVDDTDIDFNAKALSFDNVPQVTGAPATSATLKAGTGTGWALLVRDENSGDIKKLLASDLIVSGHTVFTATTTATNGILAGAELEFDVATAGAYNGAAITALTGVKIPLPDYEKVWVYRNGAKLIAGVDYTITGSKVTLVPIATGPNSWAVYAGDVIEVQYFK
ncbi:hypothetical protein N9R87_00325 [Flavobacteriaceae bacterium]|nr:hypothetical protein [Flavobacteriaceae bacterium]